MGLSWPLEPELEEAALEQRLYGQRGVEGKAARRETVDFAEVQKQLQKHKHTTLLLLWQEYREVHPHGYSYSHYWSIYEVSDYLGCGSYGSRVVPEVECTS